STTIIDNAMSTRKMIPVPAHVQRSASCPSNVIVDDGNPCTTDAFNSMTGVVTHTALADGAGCSDGNRCNGDETCHSGQCLPGTPVVLTDNNPCTIDTCDPTAGTVTHVTGPDGTACTDGNACTVGDQCRAGACVPGTNVTCPGDACRPAGTCNP